MPYFEVKYTVDDQGEEFSLNTQLPLDNDEFGTRYLYLLDELYVETGGLTSITTITAAEPINETVAKGDEVWRDWQNCDLMTAEGRVATIGLLRAFKPLWTDRGNGLEILMEMLAPTEEEVSEYGITADQGYLLPQSS